MFMSFMYAAFNLLLANFYSYQPLFEVQYQNVQMGWYIAVIIPFLAVLSSAQGHYVFLSNPTMLS